MFAVMGATGQTGGAVVRALMERGAAVRAISRDAARARATLNARVEVVEAEAADVERLTRAFEGVEGAYVMVVPPATSERPLADARRDAESIAAALTRARVPYAVALSSEGAHRDRGVGVIAALRTFEEALAAVGVPVTRLRSAYFMESWSDTLEPARSVGVLPSMLQPLDRPVRLVSAADVGRTAAALLLDGTPGRVINLSGPREFTPREVAAALAERLGRPVEAVAPPRDSWEEEMVAAGLSAAMAAELAAMHDAINADATGFEPGVGEDRRGEIPLGEALAALLV